MTVERLMALVIKVKDVGESKVENSPHTPSSSSRKSREFRFRFVAPGDFCTFLTNDHNVW